jgi:hypothetical protein
VDSAKLGLANVYILDGNSHVVDLKEKTCTCGGFQERLIPCCHAIAACLWQGDDPYDYIHEWCLVENY